MKVFMKTRYDKDMNMIIPHSLNIANAMYGFRELGTEIVPYTSLFNIITYVTTDDIVLDYIEQCNYVFKQFGVKPYLEDYPKDFNGFLGRKIWTDTINSISCNPNKWSAGWFVKPIKDKKFTGKIRPYLLIHSP